MGGTSIQAMTFADAQYQFFWQLVNVNVQYLAIAVAIVLGSGVLVTVGVYFVNFKPLIKKITEQERTLKNLGANVKRDNEESTKKIQGLLDAHNASVSSSQAELEAERLANRQKFSDLTAKQQEIFDGLDSKIISANNLSKTQINAQKDEVIALITNVQKQMNDVLVMTTWNEYYMWRIAKLPSNTLRALIKTIELCNAHGVRTWLVSMALDSVQELLDTNAPTNFKDKDDLARLREVLTKNEKENPEAAEKIRTLLGKIEAA